MTYIADRRVDRMQRGIAILCLILSVLIFLSGFLLLCTCPAWFATAAGVALVPACLGSGSVRVLGVLVLFSSLVVAGLEFRQERQIRHRIEEHRRRAAPINPRDCVKSLPVWQARS